MADYGTTTNNTTIPSVTITYTEVTDWGRHTNEKFVGLTFPRMYEWGGNHDRFRNN
jgi:hypothetical protein